MGIENRSVRRGGEGHGLLSWDPDGLYAQQEQITVQKRLLGLDPDRSRQVLRELTKELGLSSYYVNPRRAIRHGPSILKAALMDRFLPSDQFLNSI